MSAASCGGWPALRRAEAKKVYMVNGQVFERDQILVAVDGKTYYGRCAMCKERLSQPSWVLSGQACQQDGSVFHTTSQSPSPISTSGQPKGISGAA